MVQTFMLPRSQKGDLIYVCGLRRSTFLCAAYVVFYVAYMIAGATMFNLLERPEEDRLVSKLKLAKMEFVDKNPGLDRKCVQIIGRRNSKKILHFLYINAECDWISSKAKRLIILYLCSIGNAKFSCCTILFFIFGLQFLLFGKIKTLCKDFGTFEMVRKKKYFQKCNTFLYKNFSKLRRITTARGSRLSENYG